MRLRSIISKYSNYIPFPIYLKDLDTKDKEEKINEGNPLWLKDKKDIKKEDYKQFYNNISFNFDEPLKTIHFNAEGVINYKALLYLPTNSAAICWASAALPPFPNIKIFPPFLRQLMHKFVAKTTPSVRL